MVCGAPNGNEKKNKKKSFRLVVLFSLGKKNLHCFRRKKKHLKLGISLVCKNFDYPRKSKKQFICFLNRKSSGKTF